MFPTTFKAIRVRIFFLLFTLVVASSCALAQQATTDRHAPDLKRLQKHVEYLASDELEGRRTGTPGAERAARYVAEEFARYGLAGGGNAKMIISAGAGGGEREAAHYLQAFPYVAGVELGKANTMTYTARAGEASGGAQGASLDLRVGEDWLPLGFSAQGRVEQAPVVFVGYGITAADLNYDDYAGADAGWHIALAFSGTPDGDNPHGRFVRFGELRFKAAAARAAGAKALIIIAADENFKNDRLARLAYDNAGGDAGLPVVVISRQAAAQLLGLGGTPQLAEFEKKTREALTASGDATKKNGYNLSVATRPAQHVSVNISTDVVRRNTVAYNVVGVLEGSDPQLKGEIIVIGAHYDHLGRGGAGSLAAREGEIHHGADDNASGTAGLMELARLLSANRREQRRSVVLVAFGGEEEGLLGSNFYVNNPPRPISQTVAMINMDMIGRLKDERLMIGGVGTATEWRGWVEQANAPLKMQMAAGAISGSPHGGARDGLPVVVGANGQTMATAVPRRPFALTLNNDGFGPSDHSSFYAKKIPVLFFFTGTHEDYHKPTDTADRINYEGEARILSFVLNIVSDVQAATARPTYALAKTESQARSTGFRVYLGTVPNYAEGTDGMKLDAVREGSPAESAGLKAGDKIVRLAGREVRNVYDYTYVLSEMKAGQEYEVEVVRGTERLTLKITPAARR
jgi:hypothetical protein